MNTHFPNRYCYRSKLRAVPFEHANDEEMFELRRRGADGYHSNAIWRTHLTPEAETLFVMFLKERVPPGVSSPYVLRYVMG